MASLGETLIERGVLNQAQLDEATAKAEADGVGLTRMLISMGLAREDEVVSAVASRLGLDFCSLEPGTMNPDALELLSPDFAREREALAVDFTDDGVLVAVADPTVMKAKAEFESEAGMPVSFALASKAALTQALEASAGGGSGPKRASFADELAPSSGPRIMAEEASNVDLDELLQKLVEQGGSDLHLTVGIPPSIRIRGDIVRLDEYEKLNGDELRKMLYGIMTQRHREEFENNLELDLSYSVPGLARFRVNIFQQRDQIGSVMRLIPFEILSLDTLGMPEQIANFAYEARGFVLVTGPTGSGKSTTLASLVDLVNANRAAHVMTVEDPIEFLHSHKKSIINQREVGTDTHGFAQALKHVLRQDPDVILVGEMRDLETIHIALTAAETGHLVFGTLHTQDAPQTVDRIIDVFPPHQQEQIRVQLAGALKGVVCQTLVKTADGKGRAAATEIMVVNSGISNLIREGKTHQIYSMIQAGGKHGMLSMDASLAELVKSGRVSYDDALEKCNKLEEFQRLTGTSD